MVGYRIDRKDPWRRRFLSRGYNLLARTLLGTRVRDCDCALKVFRRTELNHILPNATNFFVNTEMLTRARQCNLAVAEVGVTHRPRLRGHEQGVADGGAENAGGAAAVLVVAGAVSGGCRPEGARGARGSPSLTPGY